MKAPLVAAKNARTLIPLIPLLRRADNKGIREGTGGAQPATKGTLEKKGCLRADARPALGRTPA
jgi:hypothetical protein